MIFERFGKALGQKDWSTMLFEIAIVVLGIFLGLRVDEWNQERLLDQQEKVYLQVVANDLARMRVEVEEAISQRTLRADRMTQALRALENCDDSDESHEAVRMTMEQYQMSGPINFIGGTFDEMVATGALARVQDQSLKADLSTTFAALAELNQSFYSVRLSIPVVDAIAWDAVDFTVDRETQRTRADVDVADLCQNRQVRNAVVEMIDIQRDGAGFSQRVLDRIDALMPRLPAPATGS